MNKPTPASPGEHPVDLAVESVAGEEDPGASIDIAAIPTSAPGEHPCRTCGGAGQLNGSPCPDCDGAGRVGATGA